jgi:hypothetical protein
VFSTNKQLYEAARGISDFEAYCQSHADKALSAALLLQMQNKAAVLVAKSGSLEFIEKM